MPSLPSHFNGQISLEPMKIPINLGCHETHNFELDQIQKWINSGGEYNQGQPNCPTCRAVVQPHKISYNTSLANEIRSFATSNPRAIPPKYLWKLARTKCLSKKNIRRKVNNLRSLANRKIQLLYGSSEMKDDSFSATSFQSRRVAILNPNDDGVSFSRNRIATTCVAVSIIAISLFGFVYSFSAR
ncbi:MAG: hypothetical protein ACI9S8_002401 [Chlamydiales bacterium]